LLLPLLLCKWIEAALRWAACLLRGKLAVLRLAEAIGYASKQQAPKRKTHCIPEGTDIPKRIDAFAITRCKEVG
jgi:hypothetical protein